MLEVPTPNNDQPSTPPETTGFWVFASSIDKLACCPSADEVRATNSPDILAQDERALCLRATLLARSIMQTEAGPQEVCLYDFPLINALGFKAMEALKQDYEAIRAAGGGEELIIPHADSGQQAMTLVPRELIREAGRHLAL